MVSANVGTRRGASARAIGAAAGLSAINAENQQIIKQTPNFTPKNVKLGVFILFKTNHIRSENNLIKNRTNEKNNQFMAQFENLGELVKSTIFVA